MDEARKLTNAKRFKENTISTRNVSEEEPSRTEHVLNTKEWPTISCKAIGRMKTLDNNRVVDSISKKDETKEITIPELEEINDNNAKIKNDRKLVIRISRPRSTMPTIIINKEINKRER